MTALSECMSIATNFIQEEPTETSTQDSKNKISDMQKANPNSLIMSLTKDMK